MRSRLKNFLEISTFLMEAYADRPKGLRAGSINGGANGVVPRQCLMSAGERVFSREKNKGDFRMGTVSFLLIVVALFGGGYTVLRRINSKSYLHGSPNKAVEHRRAPARKLVDQSISNRERRYVEWYLENGHKRQQARSLGPVRQPSAMVGVAFLSNDPEQQRRAGLA